MKTDWRKFPDNIGHLYYRGCFRCHDGKHVNEQERSFEGLQHVPHHLAQFEDDTLRISTGGIEYRHPVDIGDARWR